jgi:hypothetical protein
MIIILCVDRLDWLGYKRRSFDNGWDYSMRPKRSWILSHRRAVGHPGSGGSNEQNFK